MHRGWVSYLLNFKSLLLRNRQVLHFFILLPNRPHQLRFTHLHTYLDLHNSFRDLILSNPEHKRDLVFKSIGQLVRWFRIIHVQKFRLFFITLTYTEPSPPQLIAKPEPVWGHIFTNRANQNLARAGSCFILSPGFIF